MNVSLEFAEKMVLSSFVSRLIAPILHNHWHKKMDKIKGVDPTTREQKHGSRNAIEEIPVIIKNFTQPESTIEIKSIYN